MKRDQRGFSLVEIIVVIAITAILVGSSVTMINYIRYANTQKAVEAVGDMLDRQRISSMSQQGTQYLYIYRLDDGYYMKALYNTKLSSYNSGSLGSGGIKICSESIAIRWEDFDGNQTELQKENQVIRVVFKRSGVLNTDPRENSYSTNVSKIIFEGSSTYTITLIEETGKHIIEP